MPRIFATLDKNFTGNSDFYLSYTYDRQKKVWTFVGYRCLKCSTTLKHVNSTYKHLNSCKSVSRRTKYKDPDTIEGIVIDVNGNEWQPISVNVHETTKHSLKE